MPPAGGRGRGGQAAQGSSKTPQQAAGASEVGKQNASSTSDVGLTGSVPAPEKTMETSSSDGLDTSSTSLLQAQDTESVQTESAQSETGVKGTEQSAQDSTQEILVEDDDDDVIIIEDDEPTKSQLSGVGLWRVRACPILFDAFSTNLSVVQRIMNLCYSLEYRMSRHLGTTLGQDPKRNQLEKGVPWLPNEKVYTKNTSAGCAGMLDMVVQDANLEKLLELLRAIDKMRNNRLRVELARLRKTELKELSSGAVSSSKRRKLNAKEGGNEIVLKPEGMVVKFAVRPEPLHISNLAPKPDHVATIEDNYIFLNKVPDEVEDSLLKAIMMAEMVERTYGENNTGTAKFNIKDAMGPTVYMETYDGILVDDKDIEMSTTLGTLYEAKKTRVIKQQRNRLSNEQKSRMMAARGQKKTRPGQGIRGGMRGVSRGAGQGVRGRGVRGVSRGAVQGMRGRGVRGVSRGAGQRGRGISPGMSRSKRGFGRGSVSPQKGQRGAFFGRGMPLPSLLGPPMLPPFEERNRGPRDQMMMMSPESLDDIEAKVLATRRELSMLERHARMISAEELGRVDMHPGRRDPGFGRERDRYDPYPVHRGYRPDDRRRW